MPHANRRYFIKQGIALGAGLFSADARFRAAACDPADRAISSAPEPAFRPPRLVDKTLFIKSPKPRAAVWVNTYYTRATGLEMACVMRCTMKDDVFTDWQRRFSPDNGKTWSEWAKLKDVRVEQPEGVHCRYPLPGWVDPVKGRMLMMALDDVLPEGNPWKAVWWMRYRVSTDGGRTFAVDEPVIQRGDYTPEHPMEGVWRRKNGVGLSETNIIRTREGRILVPFSATPNVHDERGGKRGGSVSYSDAAVLIGEWTEDMKIAWDVSEHVETTPKISTRGLLEPTVAEMPDGRILMVCRGSNHAWPSYAKPKIPGYKWYSVSTDGGRHWSNPPKPWTYHDGERFFSPSSCSQLIRHSNGKIYWLGNISPTNPHGNLPRHPLVIGEVDAESLLLRKETVAVIDTRGPEDDESLQLSNFMVHEDRVDGAIVLNVTRFMPKPDWKGDCYTYRIEP